MTLIIECGHVRGHGAVLMKKKRKGAAGGRGYGSLSAVRRFSYRSADNKELSESIVDNVNCNCESSCTAQLHHGSGNAAESKV